MQQFSAALRAAVGDEAVVWVEEVEAGGVDVEDTLAGSTRGVEGRNGTHGFGRNCGFLSCSPGTRNCFLEDLSRKELKLGKRRRRCNLGGILGKHN